MRKTRQGKTHVGKRKVNITRAKARARAYKAWRTKYARYHYASEDPDNIDEELRFKQQKKGLDEEARERAATSEEKEIRGVLGTHGHGLTELDLFRQREEAKRSEFRKIQDVLDDPEISALLEKAAREGRTGEIKQFEQNILGYTMATKRQKRARLEARSRGTKEGEVSEYTFADTGDQIFKAAQGFLNFQPRKVHKKRKEGIEGWEQSIHETISEKIGQYGSQDDADQLAGAIINHIKQHRGTDTHEESLRAVKRLAAKIATKTDNAEEIGLARAGITSLRQQVQRDQVRARQGIAKWGTLGRLSATLPEKTFGPLSKDPEKAAKELEERAKQIEGELRRAISEPWNPHGVTQVTPDIPKSKDRASPRSTDRRSPEELRKDASQAIPEITSIDPTMPIWIAGQKDKEKSFEQQGADRRRARNQAAQAARRKKEQLKPSGKDRLKVADDDTVVIREMQKVYSDKYNEIRGKQLEKDLSQDEISNLSKLIVKPNKTQEEKDQAKEWLDSLRLRTALAWDPSLINDPAVQRLYGRYSTVPKKPQRFKETSEEFYRRKGYGETGIGPKHWRRQYEFIKDQKINELNNFRKGDVYIGYDSKGRAVAPENARFGMTANKHWRFRKKVQGSDEEIEEIMLHDPEHGLIVKSGGKGGKTEGERFGASMEGGFEPVGFISNVGTSRFIDQPFGTKQEPPKHRDEKGNEVIAPHELQRTFERPLNIRMGTRKLHPDYEKPLPHGIHTERIVPLHSIKKPQERTVDFYKQVPDPTSGVEQRTKLETYKERIRYVPYEHTKMEKGQHDQFAAKIPGGSIPLPGGGREVGKIKIPKRANIGERVLFFNFDDADTGTIGNVSKYALGPARARRERKLREMTETAAWLKESEGEVTVAQMRDYFGSKAGYGGYRYEYDKEGNVKAQPLDRSSRSNETIAFMAKNTPEAHARMADIAARDLEKAGRHDEAKRIRDLGAAAVGATILGTRRRAKHYWIPNRIQERHPRLNRKLKSWSVHLDEGLIDTKKGIYEPLLAEAIDFKYKLRHPLSSPTGRTFGVEFGSIYNRDKWIHPLRKEGRQFKRQAEQLGRLQRVDEFFEGAASPDASFFKRRLAKRRDHLLRDQRYQAYLDREARMSVVRDLQKQLKNADKDNRFLDYSGVRGVSASLFRMEQKERLRKTLEDIENKTLTGWSEPLKGGVSPGNELLAPAAWKPLREAHFKSVAAGRKRNRNLLIGAAVVGTALGAGYLYHRHKQKDKPEEEKEHYYNRFIPGPVSVPAPYVRTIRKTPVPKHAFTEELGLVGRQAPTRWAAGFGKRTIWKGKPKDRGYERGPVGITGVRFTRPKDGKTTGKIFMEPTDFKRIQDRRTHRLTVGGREVPLAIKIGERKQFKKVRKNPNALTAKDRENLVWAFGIRDFERRIDPNIYPVISEHKRTVDFFESGVPDIRTVNALTDDDTVKRIRKKKGGQTTARAFKELTPTQERKVGEQRRRMQMGVTGRIRSRDERLQNAFEAGRTDI